MADARNTNSRRWSEHERPAVIHGDTTVYTIHITCLVDYVFEDESVAAVIISTVTSTNVGLVSLMYP